MKNSGAKPSPSSPLKVKEDLIERYYFGNRFNGIILEIRGSNYTESYRSIRDGSEVLISEGSCDRGQATLNLREAKSEVQREFYRLDDELLCREGFVTYQKTDLDWEEILGRECPYRVDGIRLGDSLPEVEALWGPLELQETSRRYQASGPGYRWVEIDSYGRVDVIGGSNLVRGDESLLSTEEPLEAALKFGAKREYQVVCQSGGPRGIRAIERVLGDYDLVVVGYHQESLEQHSPDTFQTMKTAGVAFDKVLYLELRHRYLTPEDLEMKPRG